MSAEIPEGFVPAAESGQFEALVKELGAANALRFVGLYGSSHGDYTRDRHQWLAGTTLEQIEADIQQMRRQGGL